MLVCAGLKPGATFSRRVCCRGLGKLGRLVWEVARPAELGQRADLVGGSRRLWMGRDPAAMLRCAQRESFEAERLATESVTVRELGVLAGLWVGRDFSAVRAAAGRVGRARGSGSCNWR